MPPQEQQREKVTECMEKGLGRVRKEMMRAAAIAGQAFTTFSLSVWSFQARKDGSLLQNLIGVGKGKRAET